MLPQGNTSYVENRLSDSVPEPESAKVCELRANHAPTGKETVHCAANRAPTDKYTLASRDEPRLGRPKPITDIARPYKGRPLPADTHDLPC